MRGGRLLFLVFVGAALACGGACGSGASPSPDDPSRAEARPTPDENLGPIDPQWPPLHPADVNVELRAGQLLRERLARGEEADTDEPWFEGDHSDVYAHQGRIGDFAYIEAIVGEVQSIDEELPLVVMLHGRGGRPGIPRTGMAGDPPVRVFAPRAPERLGDEGFTWLATWTNSGQTELLARSIAERVDELAPAIEAYRQLRPTRGKPIVVGFSQGGIMTYGLVTRYPRMFAAGFPVAGWLPEANLPERPAEGVSFPPMHAMHGTSDETVPFANGRETVRALRQLGIAVEWTQVPDVAHEVTAEMKRTVRGWIGDALFPERRGANEPRP